MISRFLRAIAAALPLAACAPDEAMDGPFTTAHAQKAIQRLETDQIESLFDGDFEKPARLAISNVGIVKEGTLPESNGKSTVFWNVQADLEWRCSGGESIKKPGKIYLVTTQAKGYAAGFDLFHGRGPEGCRKKR